MYFVNSTFCFVSVVLQGGRRVEALGMAVLFCWKGGMLTTLKVDIFIGNLNGHLCSTAFQLPEKRQKHY